MNDDFGALSATLYAFYSGFGVPAYTEDAVPSDVKEPYITYTLTCPAWRDTVTHQARVWTRSESNAQLMELTGRVLSMVADGLTLPVIGANGYVTLDPGTPFVQMQPIDDPLLKVSYINMILGAVFARKGA